MKTADGISRGQAHEAMNQVERTMKLMGVEDPQEIMSELIKDQFFRKSVKERLSRKGLRYNDPRFGTSIRTFRLTVPEDYGHDMQLDRFKRIFGKKMSFWEGLTDINYSETPCVLRPGETYTVGIFPIMSRVTLEDCLEFMTDKELLDVGAQGLSLAYQLESHNFPYGCIDSCTQERFLPKDGDFIAVPRITHLETRGRESVFGRSDFSAPDKAISPCGPTFLLGFFHPEALFN